jgi:excisionase family DNA binding protein
MEQTNFSSKFLTTKEAAEILSIKPNTLEIWRVQGKSPVFLKIGRNVRYELSEIEKFIHESRRNSTSDMGPMEA